MGVSGFEKPEWLAQMAIVLVLPVKLVGIGIQQQNKLLFLRELADLLPEISFFVVRFLTNNTSVMLHLLIKFLFKSLVVSIFAGSCFFCSPNLNGQAIWNNTSFVHRSGQDILDGQNNIIKLNGVNLGGWLMWEGWIWGGGFTAEKDFNNKMASIIGIPATNDFRNAVYRNFITRVDIEKIADECFNIVRIPINHTLLEDDAAPYVYKQSGWAVLDSVLKWCEDYNVYALIDLHSAPGGQNTGFISDPDPINLWQSNTNKDRTVKLWKAIADRYKNRGIVAGYDLLNEPNLANNNELLNL